MLLSNMTATSTFVSGRVFSDWLLRIGSPSGALTVKDLSKGAPFSRNVDIFC